MVLLSRKIRSRFIKAVAFLLDLSREIRYSYIVEGFCVEDSPSGIRHGEDNTAQTLNFCGKVS